MNTNELVGITTLRETANQRGPIGRTGFRPSQTKYHSEPPLPGEHEVVFMTSIMHMNKIKLEISTDT